MKLTDRGNNNYTLEGITQKDIKYTNLAGRPVNSIYYDPDRPQHVVVIWLDPAVADQLTEYGFKISEAEDTFNDMGVRPFMQLKAYPKMRVNPMTAKEEQVPKVILKTSGNAIRLKAESFALVDISRIHSTDISFHSWVYDEHRPPVAVLDGLWCTADDTAGGRNDYFDEDYGYEEPDFKPEEVPFE